VPYPIQSGSITDRLRKFFRIRGRTTFALDEIVAPVVMVQDLTKGPYQSGVTPAGGTRQLNPNVGQAWTFAILLNDKLGSVTEVLDRQFDNRSFSFTWAELINKSAAPTVDGFLDLGMAVVPRSLIFGAGIPQTSSQLISILDNDSTQKVPVEIFGFLEQLSFPNSNLWVGTLGDNVNSPGSTRTWDDIQPNITIGPTGALIIAGGDLPSSASVAVSLRGFYQEQPA